MMNISSRLSTVAFVFALMGLVGCKDSGHSLGDVRDLDAGKGDVPLANGGSGGATIASTQSGGSTGSAGSVSSSSGGAGGQSGSSLSSDAGSDTALGCANRGESCANRPCCGLPLVCKDFTNPPSCFESARPDFDADLSLDTRPVSDSKCPTCPPMKCTYGSPVDSNGCTICSCNPPPDAGADTVSRCPAGGCTDADLSTPCPAQPPVDGSPCLGQGVCNYEDCPGKGHTQATCRSEKWVVANGPCDTVTCLGAGGGVTCPTNKVCIIHAGGALSIDCADNPCRPGLVSADCSTTTAGCTPILSTSSGLTFYCNTCPVGTCP